MNEKQLANYRMNSEELAEWNSLAKEIYEDCNKAAVPEEYFKRYVSFFLEPYDYDNNRGYCKALGYYDVNTERGRNVLSFLGDRTAMRFYLLKQIFWSVGLQIELKKRKQLSLEWQYSVKYDSRKYRFEYEINKIHEILGQEYSAQLIDEHTDHMNRWFPDKHWEFDLNERKFVEISETEEII